MANKQLPEKAVAAKEVDAMSNQEVLATVRSIYGRQRRNDKYEPRWIGMFWADAYEPVGPEEESEASEYRSFLKSVARSPHIVTRMTGHKHVQEDGFLVATTSWVFAGRKLCAPVEYRGWIVIDREFSDDVKALERANGLGKGQPTRFYMAYSTRGPVGMSAMTGNEVGPCTSLEELKAHLNEIANAFADRGPADPRGRWGAGSTSKLDKQ